MIKKIICTLLLLTSLCLSTLVQAEEKTKIGFMLPLTGGFAIFGTEARRGAELAFQDLGLDSKYQLVFEDSKCLPKEASTAYFKLKTFDKVDFLIGPVCSGSILSVSPLVKRDNGIMLALLGAGKKVSEAGDHLFSLGFSSEDGAQQVIDHLISKNIKRVSVFYEQDTWADLVQTVFINNYREAGGKVLTVESQMPNQDYRSVILRLMSKKPDAIYAVPAYVGGEFIKQVRRLGFTVPVFGPDTFGFKEVVRVAGAAANGVVLADVSIDLERDQTKKLVNDYQKKYKSESEHLLYAALGYDGLKIAYKYLTELDKSKAKLQQLVYTEGVIPEITFDENGISKIKTKLLKIEDGKFKNLMD